MKKTIYCGNNSSHPSISSGKKKIGTRETCLRKGIKVGIAQPVDPAYLSKYTPIDKTKKYCGEESNLPSGYDRFGNLYECFSTGIGVGKRIKAKRTTRKSRSRKSRSRK